MTVAPDRPLHHAHLGDENPFELIPSPWGVIERWRASTLSTGTMGMFQNVHDAIRADAALFDSVLATYDSLQSVAGVWRYRVWRIFKPER